MDDHLTAPDGFMTPTSAQKLIRSLDFVIPSPPAVRSIVEIQCTGFESSVYFLLSTLSLFVLRFLRTEPVSDRLTPRPAAGAAQARAKFLPAFSASPRAEVSFPSSGKETLR